MQGAPKARAAPRSPFRGPAAASGLARGPALARRPVADWLYPCQPHPPGTHLHTPSIYLSRQKVSKTASTCRVSSKRQFGKTPKTPKTPKMCSYAQYDSVGKACSEIADGYSASGVTPLQCCVHMAALYALLRTEIMANRQTGSFPIQSV